MKMSIDKVGIRYAYNSSANGKDEYQQLFGFKYSLLDGSLGKTGQVWPSPKGALTNMRLTFEGGSTFFLRFGYCSKRHWAWMSFNPSKMDPGDFDELRGYLSLLYTNGSNTLWDKADLDRLDIAVDVEAEFSDLLFADDSLRTEDVSRKNAGTIYLGAQGGARNFAIYDKRKEREEVAGVLSSEPLLRIEARILDPNRYPFAGMIHLPNPFTHLRVLDKHALQLAPSELLAKYRNGLTYGYSPTRLLSYFSPADKQKLWGQFADVAPSWWNDTQVWEQYPSALEWVHNL